MPVELPVMDFAEQFLKPTSMLYRNLGAMEVEEVLTSGAALVVAPPKGIEEPVLALIRTYYDHSLKYLSKAMWRHAMALSIQAPDTPNGRHYANLDQRLAQQVGSLVSALQDRGDVAESLDSSSIGHMIFHTLNQLFIDFIKHDDMTLGDLDAQVEKQLSPLFSLLSLR